MADRQTELDALTHASRAPPDVRAPRQARLPNVRAARQGGQPNPLESVCALWSLGVALERIDPDTIVLARPAIASDQERI